MPAEAADLVDQEINHLIRNDCVAWAIRERRGITVFSSDGQRQVVLHVIATYARTRGLFMGLFPAEMRRLPDASLEILSILLRNVANCIESLNYSNMLRNQKRELESTIKEKSHQLVGYEKQLLQAQNMEAIATLAGGVAHQFNNALTSLFGYLDLLSMSVPHDSDAAGYVKRIYPTAERMRLLTSNLLDYARGSKSLTRDIPLKTILEEVLPSLRNAIKPSVALAVEPDEMALTVRVDIIQIRMVLQAIVENADESIVNEGTIRIASRAVAHDELKTKIKSELKPGNYACLSIHDSGKGMDPATLNRIFDPFFSTKFEGRGLSMAAVFGIIKNHSGWVQVTSATNRGTTVDLYLPLAAQASSS